MTTHAMGCLLPSFTLTSLIFLLLQTFSSRFLLLSSKSATFFLLSSPLSFSSRFLSPSPHRRNALLFNDASQFRKLFGIHDLMNLTTTHLGRCCPHSVDDENEVKGDEVTCPKPHNHVTTEASIGLYSFL